MECIRLAKPPKRESSGRIESESFNSVRYNVCQNSVHAWACSYSHRHVLSFSLQASESCRVRDSRGRDLEMVRNDLSACWLTISSNSWLVAVIWRIQSRIKPLTL